MENRTVEELIEELQELRIRETEIIAELKQANSAGTRTQTGDANSHRHEGQASVAHGFRRGDRVRVINKVRKPATAGPSWNEAKERLATVTRIILGGLSYAWVNWIIGNVTEVIFFFLEHTEVIFWEFYLLVFWNKP